MKEHTEILKTNPEWIKKERKRGRDKYYRLGYIVNGRGKYRDSTIYPKKYPEKYLAKIKSQYIEIPEGLQKHHWSYNKEHWKDVLFFDNREHSKLHRYMIYDQERMMYRDLEGKLLDTKEKHIQYYQLLKDLD